MAEKTLKTRIIQKHDTEANWLLATNFTPMNGEIIIYDEDDNYNYKRIKIGNGTDNVNDLDFVVNKEDVPTQVQADWDQNDENAPGYIKNKTHYEHIEEISILGSVTIDSSDGGKLNRKLKTVDIKDVGTTYYKFDIGSVVHICKVVITDTTKLGELIWLTDPVPYNIITLKYNSARKFNYLTTNKLPYVQDETLYSFSHVEFTRKQLDEKYIPDTIARSKDIPVDPINSDWNQNDYKKLDYIKNRPFYFLDEEIICDANLDFSKGISYINNTTPVRDILKEGETYYVIWDGAEYECIAVKSDYEHVFVGNLSIAEDSEWATENHEPTNEPFFFGTYYVYNGENGTWKEINCLDTEIHTIKVVRRPNLIVQLDEKYIPDTIARKADIPEVQEQVQSDWLISDENNPAYIKNKTHGLDSTVFLPLTECIASDGNEDGVNDTFALPSLVSGIEIGESYTVNYNGVDYECVARLIDDGSTTLGNIDLQMGTGDTGEPFVVVIFPEESFNNIGVGGVVVPVPHHTSTVTSITVSIKRESIHKLDEKFIPDTIARIDSIPEVDLTSYQTKSDENLTTTDKTIVGAINEIEDGLVGENTTGTVYTIDNESVTAAEGAEIFNDYTNNKAVGKYSHAEGSTTIATGDMSHAEGGYTESNGINSHAEGGGTTASGNNSHAEGGATTASGHYSHAEGQNTSATGNFSHTEGQNTSATRDASHAEGQNTTASGFHSHAEGLFTEAIKAGSHAEGYGSKASGDYSHAEGFYTESNGKGSHAEGGNLDRGGSTATSTYTVSSKDYSEITTPITVNGSIAQGIHSHVEGAQSLAYGYASHAEGEKSKAFNAASHAEGADTKSSGYASHAEGNMTKATGMGSHAEGMNSKATGDMSHAEGNGAKASGAMSHAEGYGTIASAIGAHAEGNNSQATANYAHAEGTGTVASSENSHAEGNSTTASGYMSHAEGNSMNKLPSSITSTTSDTNIISTWNSKKFTLAKGQSSHAEGENVLALNTASHAEGQMTIASGAFSHAEGLQTIASAMCAHAEGNNSQAIGMGSHAEGMNSKATGDMSHAEGNGAQASGVFSHAEGLQTIASAMGAHAEGNNSQATANYAHAEGTGTVASSENSHAEGNLSIASGDMSHAEGYGTIAKSNFQHVEGQYNIEDSTNKYAHIVGNGSGNARSNAHTLDWEGNAWYQGNVYVGGTSQDDASQLATTTFVEEKVAALVDSAPETLDTLNELATAIQDHQSVTDTLNAAIGDKQNKTDEALNTTDKTVVGAINELNTLMGTHTHTMETIIIEDEEALTLLMELDLVEPAGTEDGGLYIDENNSILIL